jgi:transposase
MRTISLATIHSIQNLLQHGHSLRQIAKSLHLSLSTISKYQKIHCPFVQKAKRGRIPKITKYKKRLIKRQILDGQLQTAAQVHRYLVQEGYQLSYSSVCKTLKSMGFEARIKKKKPFLTKRHRFLRYQWAKRYQHWTVADWSKVIFSDETKINVWGSDGVKYYWTRPGDPLKPHHLDLTVKFGKGSLMMWGCMSINGVGYACSIEGTMDASLYCDILQGTFQESLGWWNMGYEDIIFQQDNDPKHTSKMAKKWFSDQGLQVLEWPAQSPDLNPIEHLWHHLKLKLSKYEQQAAGVGELWDRVDTEWNSFTAEECKRYIESMAARVQAVLKAKGGHTRY